VQILSAEPSGGRWKVRVGLVDSLPAMGWKGYRVIHGKVGENGLKASSDLLESPFFRVEIDRERGWIARIRDLRYGVDLLREPGGRLVVLSDTSDTWSHGVKSYRDEVGAFVRSGTIEVLEQGPVRVGVRIPLAFRNSQAILDVFLYRDLPRIDFSLLLDWHETEKVLKVSFPLQIEKGQPTYEIPFGAVTRQATGDEEPGQRWVDVSGWVRDSRGQGLAYGVTLVNDSKYSYSVDGSDLRMTLLRSPLFAFHDFKGIVIKKSDLYIDQGEQKVRWALIPHVGDWRSLPATRLGWQFNTPLRFLKGKGGNPAEKNLLRVAPENLVSVAVKKAEISEEMVIRVYETAGLRTQGWIEIPPLGIHQEIELGPHEIATFVLSPEDRKLRRPARPGPAQPGPARPEADFLR